MINQFFMNGICWVIKTVKPDAQMLIDRTGNRTVATTDPVEKVVYLSSDLKGDFLVKVLVHELGHCAIVSFDLLDDIHSCVSQDKWIEAEEWVCNFIAEYGMLIFKILYEYIGDYAIEIIPREFERVLI